MRKKDKFSTRRMVLAALLAALTVAGSAIRITLPIDIAGTTSFHLGNIMCALCGILLGPWLGGAASGLGSAIYDMFNPLYISEAWITFLLKGIYGLAAGLITRCGKTPWGYVRATIGSAAGAIAYGIMYLLKSYFYNGLLLSGLSHEAAMLTIWSKLPSTIFNAAVAVIFAPILATAIRTALKRNHLYLEDRR